jgi:ApbE superfamily uncharacterized protein (UPF0280 family)
MFKERSYRGWVQSDDLISFEVKERETDLFILAKKLLKNQARESILSNRGDIEAYIKNNPNFYDTLDPMQPADNAPAIINFMCDAAWRAGVGPMASVAGAIAEFVGRDLSSFSDEIVVENGGDIFIKTAKKRIIGIYAGDDSPFTGKLALEISPNDNGVGVCTSSGTVSHSLSFGRADAALVISDNTALADAVATVAGNAVKSAIDIEKGIQLAKSISGVKGVLILVGDKMGSWGEIKLV